MADQLFWWFLHRWNNSFIIGNCSYRRYLATNCRQILNIMINLLKTSVIAVTAITLNTAGLVVGADEFVKTVESKPLQTNEAAAIDQLSILCSKQLRASALAASQGSAQSKRLAQRLSTTLTAFSEEIRTLAKNEKIELSTSFSENSVLRPDGRVDANSENLKDTARIRNNGGEAGNSGAVKAKPMGINHQANNALIESLKKLKGEPFDSAYKNLLISDRAVAEKLLNQISSSSDPQISTFGKKYLSMLNQAKTGN